MRSINLILDLVGELLEIVFGPLLVVGLLVWGLFSVTAWADFALATVPSVALLAFVICFLIVLTTLLIMRWLLRDPEIDQELSKFPRPPSVLLLWYRKLRERGRDPDIEREHRLLPDRSLSTLFTVSIFDATFWGVAVGVSVALLGWPAFFALRWMLGLPVEFEGKLISFLNAYVFLPNLYATTSIVVIAFALWLARFGRAQQRSKISEGFHRIGVAVGLSLFGLFSIVTFIGIFGADEGRLSMWLIYEMIGGVAVLGLYGLVRLIGWIADGFASGLKMR